MRGRPKMLQQATAAALLAGAMRGAANAIDVGRVTFSELAQAVRPRAAPKVKGWQPSGRKGARTRRKKHRGPKPIRSWRKTRVQALRKRRR